MRGLRVAKRRAEEVRQRLKRAGWIRPDASVLSEGEDVVFALQDAARPAPDDGTVVERTFPLRPASAASYRDALAGLPPEVRDVLPRAFDVVGDLVLVRLPPEAVPWKAEVGRALLDFVPGARYVGWDQGVKGVERRRRIERIAGAGALQTRVRENGLTLDVDLDRAYFSPRLAREHARVAGEVAAGETVLDLCCGIGPFALTIARDGRARSVTAVDVNPDAIALLRANAARLGVSDRIDARVADLAVFLAEPHPADRAILNLPHEGIKYLPSVAEQVVRAGTLHYYEIMERTVESGRPHALVDRLRAVGPWAVRSMHRVHPYSPTSDLVAVTLVRGPEAA